MRALRSVRRRRTAWLAERLEGLSAAELAAVDRAIEALVAAGGGRGVTAALLALNSRTFSSLRKHRNYRLYFIGQIVSVSGTWMQDTALPWLILGLTHSPVYVGAAGVRAVRAVHALRAALRACSPTGSTTGGR